MTTINVLQNRFEIYFGGPCLEFGHALYDKFFGIQQVIDEELFVRALSQLIDVSHNLDYHVIEGFYFSVFAHGKDTIDKEGLYLLLIIIMLCENGYICFM